jgi:hypothetical protein
MTPPSQEQPSWTSITTHELYYLLSLGEGPSNELGRRRLGIGDERTPSDDMALAGASTLLVRGLAKLGEASVEPMDGCALLSWVLSTAHTWYEVGVTAGENANALLVLTNDEAGAALAPSTLGIFQFALLDPGSASVGAALAFTSSVLDAGPQVAVSVRRITMGGQHSAAVVRDGPCWRVARPLNEESDPSVEPTACTEDQARQALEEVLR